MKKVILRDRLYVPVKFIGKEAENLLLEKLTYTQEVKLTPELCRACYEEYEGEPPCSIDKSDCPNRYKTHYMFDRVKIKKEWFIAAWRGDMPLLKEVFKFKFVDRRSYNRACKPLCFTGSLRSYQREAVLGWAKVKGGMIEAPARSGKCVVAGTIIFTDKGIIPVEQEVVKTQKKCVSILTDNGKQQTSHTYKKYTDKTISIETSLGYKLGGTFEHPVKVFTRRLTYVWKRLDRLEKGDFVCINKNKHLWGKKDYNITYKVTDYDYTLCRKNNSLAFYPIVMNNDLARLLGYLVANGSLSNAYIAFSSDNDLVQKDIKNIFKTHFGISVKFRMSGNNNVFEFRLNSHMPFRDYLKSVGLKLVKSKYKEIPFSVLQSKKDKVTSFLSAYFTCDSYIKSSPIELCSASEKLMHQVHVVLLNYGIVSEFKKTVGFARNSNTPVKRDYYIINVSGNFRPLFYNTFNLLKDLPKNKDNFQQSYKIPYVSDWLQALKNKFEIGGGTYKINGKISRFKFFKSGKYFFSKRHDRRVTLDFIKNIEPLAIEAFNKVTARKIVDVINNDYIYDPVVTIKKDYHRVPVYDFTVPEGHNFVANGIISHNTVIGTYIAAKLHMKTLILTHQKDLLYQFYDTFAKFTDEPKLKNVIVCEGNIVEAVEQGYDVILSTYQTFISEKGKERLKKVKNYFGLVMVDEAHLGSAEKFCEVCNTLNPVYRLGLTATPKRKDGNHILGYHTLGPVVSKVNPAQMTGKAEMIYTGISVGQFSNWATMVNRLAYSEKRNKIIIDYIKKDLAAGHYVLLVSDRTRQCDEIHDMLLEDKIDSLIYYGKTVNRKDKLEELVSGKHKVTLATRGIAKYGLNVPPWSSYYCVCPTANKYSFYQEMSRVRTPCKGKKEPLLRIFVDSFGAAYSCAKTCEKVILEQKFTITKHNVDGKAIIKKQRKAKKKSEKAINSWNKFTGL